WSEYPSVVTPKWSSGRLEGRGEYHKRRNECVYPLWTANTLEPGQFPNQQWPMHPHYNGSEAYRHQQSTPRHNYPSPYRHQNLHQQLTGPPLAKGALSLAGKRDY